MWKLNKQIGNHPIGTKVVPIEHICGNPHAIVVFLDDNKQGQVNFDDMDIMPDIAMHEQAIDIALDEAGVRIKED